MKNFKQEFQLLINLYKQKNFSKAELLSKRLLNIYPNNILLYNVLGLILNEQKRTDEAIECYEKGLKIDPNFAMFYNNLGSIFNSKELYDKAESYYKKSIDLDNKLAEPQNNLGNLYKFLNRYKEAITCYKQAINLNPNFFAFHYNLAVAYKSTGVFDKAKIHFEECIRLKQNFYTAHRNLSDLIKYNEEDKHFISLKKLYEDKKVEKKNKKELAFALGKAYEDMKNFNKAFEYFDEGNYLHRKNLLFSMEKEKNEFLRIKQIFNEKLFNKFKVSGNQDFSPIFILGMPRSGTTLVEQIISSHPEVFGGDELNFLTDIVKKNFKDKNFELILQKFSSLNEHDLIKLGTEYINNLKNKSNNSNRTTDKLPINFKWIGLIKLLVPNSKIIHCYRNPEDNCLSIFKNFFTSKELTFAYNLEEIIEFYNLYENLMIYWKKLLPKFIIDIKYENIVQNPEEQIKSLIDNCNLSWNDTCLKFYNNKRAISTASDAQARKKIYKTSINTWKKYEKHLKKSFQKLTAQIS